MVPEPPDQAIPEVVDVEMGLIFVVDCKLFKILESALRHLDCIRRGAVIVTPQRYRFVEKIVCVSIPVHPEKQIVVLISYELLIESSKSCKRRSLNQAGRGKNKHILADEFEGGPLFRVTPFA